MALINTTTTGVLGTTVYGDGVGALTVQQDGVTLNKFTTAPAFSAALSTNQSATAGTWTKINVDSKSFDTAGVFSAGRFTPNVMGYYSVTGMWSAITASTSLVSIAFYKNGSNVSQGMTLSGSTNYRLSHNDLIYMNGTTDYLEFWGYSNDGFTAGSFFKGFLARAG